jgi:hypothetical protein
VVEFMAKKLLKFICQYQPCEKKENFIDLPEDEAKRTRWLIYCGNCGRVVMTKKEIEKEANGSTWLPCVEYNGPGGKLTRGPIPNDELGNSWGDPTGGNLSEEEFMKKYNINPRVDWCRRKRLDASSHPSYNKICSDINNRKLGPIEYVPLDPIINHDEYKPEILR